MANIKFSQFTVETAKADVDFLVGYSGPDNVQISPTNLLADYPTGSGAAGQVTFFSAASTVAGDNDFYWDNTNKRLGIGTTSPTRNLVVSGVGSSASTYIKILGDTSQEAILELHADNDSPGDRWRIAASNSSKLQIRSNGSNVLSVTSSENVGIGTTSPSAKLEVDGTLIATGISQLGSGGSNVLLTSSSAGNVGIGDSSPTAKLVVNNTGTKMLELRRNNNIKFRALADANHAQLDMFNSSGTKNISLHTNSVSYFNGGNVGIGTVSPGSKLHIDEAGTSFPALFIDTARYGASIIGDGTSNSQYLLNLQSNGGSTDVMRVQSSGNVGIGTNSPNYNLHVKKSSSNSAITIEGNTNAGANFSSRLNFSNKDTSGNNIDFTIGLKKTNNFVFLGNAAANELMRIEGNTGKVGIGTTSPDTILEVVNDVNNSSSPATDVNAGIIIHNGNSSGTAVLKLRGSGGDSGAVVFGGGGGAASDKFHIISRHNQTKRFTVQANGNVGIGTSSPTAKLTVDSGDVEVTLNTKGIILKSPDGTRYRITVANGGSLTSTALP